MRANAHRAAEPPVELWERESTRPRSLATAMLASVDAGKLTCEALEAASPLMRAMTRSQIARAHAIVRSHVLARRSLARQELSRRLVDRSPE